MQPSGGAAWKTGQGTPPDSFKGSLHDVSGLTPLSFQAGKPAGRFLPDFARSGQISTRPSWNDARYCRDTMECGGQGGRSKTPLSVMTAAWPLAAFAHQCHECHTQYPINLSMNQRLGPRSICTAPRPLLDVVHSSRDCLPSYHRVVVHCG